MKVRQVGSNYLINCPGCKQTHTVGPSWQFNGDLENPTFSPSVLVKSGHYASHHKPGDDCWCTHNERTGRSTFKCTVCHSFIRDGQWQFLSDCTHELAGKP